MELKGTDAGKKDRRPLLSPLRRRQRGQAVVFVYVFIPTLIIGMLVLYKAGKLTSDKMELQNAADATAYSVSVIEARDLNFASYMNRSIVANEVAVGQLVGIASWAFHWRSFHDYLKLYSVPLSVPPITPIGTGFRTLATFFKTTGDPASRAMSRFADIGTKITHFINWMYGGAEYAFHLASSMYVLGQIQEMIDQNGPDGARLSEFGMLSLIGHLSTFGSIPPLPGEKFTRVYNPKTRSPVSAFQNDTAGTTDAGGYGRLAALIHGSADPFVNTRGWYFDFFREMNRTGLIPNFLYHERDANGQIISRHCCGRLQGQPKAHLGIDTGDQIIPLGIGDLRLRIWLFLHMGLNRAGGSELRLIVPVRGRDKDRAAGSFFNWSAADTTNLIIELDGGFYLDGRLCFPKVCVLGVCTPSYCSKWARLAGANIFARNNRLKAIASPPSPFSSFTVLDVPFPTDVPFGAAIAQAGQPGRGSQPATFITSNKLQIGIANSPTAALRGPLPPQAYGGAANSLLAWEFPFPPGIFYQAGKADRKVNKSYKGLPTFLDTAMNRPLQGSGGPNIVIGVTMDEQSFDLGNAGQVEVEPTGRFEITEELAGEAGKEQIHALAKAEVYFKRPSDLSYYLRLDRKEEVGSAFNPYWSARLVDTSHADRTVALQLQQDVDIEGSAPPYSISSLFAPVISLLGF